MVIHLTSGQRMVLERLASGDALYEFIPGGWWIESDPIDGRIGWGLLRLMALHDESYVAEGHHIYTINEIGRMLLKLA